MKSTLSFDAEVDLIFQQAGSGAVDRSVQDKLRDIIDVRDFREDDDTDTQVLTKAFAAWRARGGGRLDLEPDRTYDLGTVTAESSIFIIAYINGGTLEGNGATLQITVTGHLVNLLYVVGCNGLVIRNLFGLDPTLEVTANGSYGARLITVDSNTSDACNGITIDNCHATGFNTFANFQGAPPAKRITNVLISDNCSATGCFYGITFQDNGDYVTGGLYAVNCGRTYFAYGITGHEISIRRSDDGTGHAASAGDLIKRYANNTTNIRLSVAFTSGSVLSALASIVTIEHSNGDGAASIIDDIELTYHIPDNVTDAVTRLKLQSRASDASGEDSSSAHYTGRISIGGQLGQISVAHVKANYSPTTPGIITLRPDFSGFSLSKTVDTPGWLMKVAPDRYVIEKFGDLTSGALVIPVGALALFRGMLRITVYAEPKGDNNDGAGSKMHLFEDLVGFWVNSGPSTDIVTGTPVLLQNRAINSSSLVRTYAAAGGAKINLTFGSDAAYAVSTAYARAEIECISRPLTRR